MARKIYQVIKRYGHNEGWSTTFRQPDAESHCHFIHGYALAFELTFESLELDHCNWVLDFGSLRPLKAWLQSTFDHKTLVTRSDPQYFALLKLYEIDKLIDMVEVSAVGCESFAEMVFNRAHKMLLDSREHPRVKLRSVKVQEHEGNSAIVISTETW